MIPQLPITQQPLRGKREEGERVVEEGNDSLRWIAATWKPKWNAMAKDSAGDFGQQQPWKCGAERGNEEEGECHQSHGVIRKIWHIDSRVQLSLQCIWHIGKCTLPVALAEITVTVALTGSHCALVANQPCSLT